MALSVYPARDLDTPSLLASVLGTFWTEIYSDQQELDGELTALALPWRQVARDNDALADSLADATFPLLQVNEWHAVTLYESERYDPHFAGLRYAQDTSVRFGDNRRFGDTVLTAQFPVPLNGIYDAPMIFDAVSSPKVCLSQDVDYRVDTSRGVLWLGTNPFADPRWQPVPLYDANGNQIDRQLTLWFWHAGIDQNRLYRRLGYAFGIAPPPTVAGRQLLSTILSALVGGTTQSLLLDFLSLLYDIPVCAADGEVVTAIFTDSRGLVLATDRQVYRAASGSLPVVSVGDVLREGDPLTDGLACTSLTRGVVPPGLTSLALGDGLLPPDFPGGVAWVDQTVPIVAMMEDGKVRISWSLGVGGEVERNFWDEVHQRGIAAGKVLAEYLDMRSAPTTPVSPMNLPATINPLRFLLSNLVRGGVLLIRLQAARIGPQAMSPSFLGWTRKIVPPHTLLLLQAVLTPINDGYLPANVGEVIGRSLAATVLGDGYPAQNTDIITIKPINYAGD